MLIYVTLLLSCAVTPVSATRGSGHSMKPDDLKGLAKYIPGKFFHVRGQGTGQIPQIGLNTAGIVNKSTILAAIEVGYRHLDTSLLNGNHKALGDAMRESGVSREAFWITTKVGFYPKNMWTMLPPLLNDFVSASGGYNFLNEKTREVEAVEHSLEEMGTKYFDLCLVHNPHGNSFELWGSYLPHMWTIQGNGLVYSWSQYLARWLAWTVSKSVNLISPTSFVHRMKSWRNLEKLYRQKKCRYIGVSNYDVDMLEEMHSYGHALPAVNQIELHPMRQQKELREYCKKHQIVLTGYGTSMLMEHSVVQEIAHAHNVSPYQVVLKWALQSGITVIPKSTSEGNMKANLETMFKFYLTKDEIKKLDELEEGRAFYWDTNIVSAGPKFGFRIPRDADEL